MAGLNNHDDDDESDRELNRVDYQDEDEKKYGDEDPAIQEGNPLNSIKGSLESVQDYTSRLEVSRKNSIKSKNTKGDNSNDNVNLNIENNSQESGNINRKISPTSIKHELNSQVSQEISLEKKITDNKKASSSDEIAFKNSNILPQDQQQSAGDMNIQESWQRTQELNPELSRKKSERTKNSRELDVALTNPNTPETSTGKFINKKSNESVKIGNNKTDKIVNKNSDKMMNKKSQLSNPNTSTGSTQDKQLNNVKEAAQTVSELNSRNTNKGCKCCGSVLCVGAKKISTKDQPLFKRKLKHHCFRSIPPFSPACWGLVPNCPKITGLTSLTEDCECADDIDQQEAIDEQLKDKEPTPATCSGACANLDRLRRLKREPIEPKLQKAKDKLGDQEDPLSRADDSDESTSSLLSDDFLDYCTRFGELMTIDERTRQLEDLKCCGPNCWKILLVSAEKASKTDGEQQRVAVDDEVNGQLMEKTRENQQLAGKVCELEGQVESLKSQLQQCNEQLADLTGKQREIGASKLADVRKDFQARGEEVLEFRDKEIIAEPVILDAGSFSDRRNTRNFGSQSVSSTPSKSRSNGVSIVSPKRSSGGSDEHPSIGKSSHAPSLRDDESGTAQFDGNLSRLGRADTRETGSATDFDKTPARPEVSKLDDTGDNGAPETRVSIDSQVNQSNLIGFGDIYDEMSLREFQEVSKLEDSDIARSGNGSLRRTEERRGKVPAREISEDNQLDKSSMAKDKDVYDEMSFRKFKEVSKLEDSDIRGSGNGSFRETEARDDKLSARKTQDSQTNGSNLGGYEDTYDKVSLRELKDVSKLEDSDIKRSGNGSLRRSEESDDKLATGEPRVSEDSQANESDSVGYKDVYDEMSFREFREVSEIVDSDIERLENGSKRRTKVEEDEKNKLATRRRADAAAAELNRQELEQWLKNLLDVLLVIRICQMCGSRKGQLMSVCEAICYKLGMKLPNDDDEKEVNEKIERSEKSRTAATAANEFQMKKLIKYQIQDAQASTKSAVDSVIEKEIPTTIGNSSRELLTDQIEPTHSIRTHSLIKKASELAKLQLSQKPIDSAIGTSTFGREEPRDIHSKVSTARDFIDSIPEGSFSHSPIGTSTPKKQATEDIRSRSPINSQNLSQFRPNPKPPLLESPREALKKNFRSDKNSSSIRIPDEILEITQTNTTAVDKSIVRGGENFETRIDIDESVNIPRVSNASSDDLKISSDPSCHPDQVNSGAGRIIITEDTPDVEAASASASETSNEMGRGEGKAVAKGYENVNGIKRMERIFFKKSSDKSGTKMNSRSKNVGEYLEQKIDDDNKKVDMQEIKMNKDRDKINNRDEKEKMGQNGSQMGKNSTTYYKEPIIHSQSTSNSQAITKSSSIIPKFPCCICRAIKMTRDQYEKTLAAEAGSDCLAESSRLRDYKSPDSYYQKDKQRQAKNTTITSLTTSVETQTHYRQRRIAPKYLPDFNCKPCDCDPCGSKSLDTENVEEDQIKSRKNVSPKPVNKRNQAVLAKIQLSKR